MAIVLNAAIKKRYDGPNKLERQTKIENVRNALYLKIKDDIIKWIKSICGQWSKSIPSDEILSISWDIFLFCLKHYKENYKFSFHCYRYTKYYLLNKFAKEGTVRIPLDELKETIAIGEDDSQNATFEQLLTIIQIRNDIPEEYRIIFDDAIQSFDKEAMPLRTKSETGLPDPVYHAVKKVLTSVIRFLVKQ